MRIEAMLKWIDLTNEWIGRIVSYSVLFMMGTIAYEVLGRYLFNRPTIWVMEVNQYVLCMYVALGGYTLLHNAHVNVEIFYDRFSPKTKARVNVLTSVCFFAVVITLLWKSGIMAWEAWEYDEHSQSLLSAQLFPSKVMVPIGAALLLLQGTAKLCRDVALLMGKADSPGTATSQDHLPGGQVS